MRCTGAPRSTSSGSTSSRQGQGELPRPLSGWRGAAACSGRPALPELSRSERQQMEQVKLYDTTLRDGMGGHGMSLSVGEKLKVVQALDALGIHLVEAGFPSSNPKEAELVERLFELELESSTISAFGMTRRGGVAVAEDPALATLVDSLAPVVCLVGKSWRLHLETVIRVPVEGRMAAVSKTIRRCRARGWSARCDTERFSDAYPVDPR